MPVWIGIGIFWRNAAPENIAWAWVWIKIVRLLIGLELYAYLTVEGGLLISQYDYDFPKAQPKNISDAIKALEKCNNSGAT